MYVISNKDIEKIDFVLNHKCQNFIHDREKIKMLFVMVEYSIQPWSFRIFLQNIKKSYRLIDFFLFYSKMQKICNF